LYTRAGRGDLTFEKKIYNNAYIEDSYNFPHNADKEFNSLVTRHQKEVAQEQIFPTGIIQQCKMLTSEESFV